MMKKKGLLIIICIVLVMVGCKGKDIISKNNNNGNTLSTEKKEINIDEDIENITIDLKYMKEKYPNKKILDWVYYHQYLNDDDLPIYSNAQKIALNDYLLSQGKDYVIYFHELTDEETTLEGIKNIVNGENPPDLLSTFIPYTDIESEEFANAGEMTNEMINSGLFLRLNDFEGNNYYEDYIKSVPNTVKEISFINNNIYGIAGSVYEGLNAVYYVNVDVANKYNIDTTEFEENTVEEVMPYINKVADGEKKTNDFITLDYTQYTNFFNPKFVIDGKRVYMQSIGSECANNSEISTITQSNAEKENNRLMLELYNKKYSIVNNYTGENENYNSDDSDDVNRTNAFVVMGTGTNNEAYQGEFLDNIKNRYGKIENIASVYSKKLPVQSNKDISFTGICSNSTNAQKALEAISYIYNNKELSELLIHGVSGKDYRIENDKVVFSEEQDYLSYHRSKYLGNPYIITDEMNKRKLAEIVNGLDEAEYNNIQNYVFDLSKLKKEVSKVMKIENKFMTDENDINNHTGLYDPKYKNFDEAWNDFDRQLKEAGIDKIIKEVRKQYEEYNK